MTQEAKQARKEAHVDMIARLVANKDFRCWIGEVLEEFCAFNQGFTQVDFYRQGIRAAGSWIIDSLAGCDGGPEMIAEIFKTMLQRKNNKESYE